MMTFYPLNKFIWTWVFPICLLRSMQRITRATDAGFLFVFKAFQQAHSKLRNCWKNTEDRQKDKPVVLVIFFMLLSYINTGYTAQKHPTDEVAFYIDSYGEIDPKSDKQVALAHQVFAQVMAVADKSTQRFPKLVVVNHKRKPWAIALPDGNIVLSKKALSTAHLNAKIEETEARLAFVLGHELAHLSHDDFWHGEALQFSEAQSKSNKNSDSSSIKETKEKELKADDKGFIYAALAGFPVKFLLQNNSNSTNFFTLWMQQSSSEPSDIANSAETRALTLQRRFLHLKEQITFFDFGMRLSHFDYCDDAIYFFKEFQKTYPGREVLNNLGFCYLQLARQAMDPDRVYLYWMPMVLDGETRAGSYIKRNGIHVKSLKQTAKGRKEGLLQEAVRYLKKAVEADKSYLPAQLNLASALLYLGKPHGARDILSDSKQLAPDNPSVQSLDALALYEQADVDQDLWPKAVAKLKKITSKPDAKPELIFNLARLLSLRPRPIEANTYWNKLAIIANHLPKPFKQIVCRKQSNITKVEACTKKSPLPTSKTPWQWPLQVAGDKPLSPKDKSILKNWKRINFDWFTKGLQGHIYQRQTDAAEVLELDQFIHMQVLKGSTLGPVNIISGFCQKPLRQRALAKGIIWSCDHWAVLTQNDKIIEAWWIAK